MKILAVSSKYKEYSRDIKYRLARELARRRYRIALYQDNNSTIAPSFPHGITSLLSPSGIAWPQKFKLENYLPYLNEDFLIIDDIMPYIPQLLCLDKGEEMPSEISPYVIAILNKDFLTRLVKPQQFMYEDFPELVDYIISKTPEMLPFPTGNPCCEGLCGKKNCPELMAEIITGGAKESDCALKNKRWM